MNRLYHTQQLSQSVEAQMKSIQRTSDLNIDEQVPTAYDLNKNIAKVGASWP